jgi:hypothetical protein
VARPEFFEGFNVTEDLMRMKLSMLFVVTAMIALVFGILFMTPVFIAGAFCTFTLILTPAIWLTGAIYARGIWRSFFIGGMFTGFVPHLIAVYYGMLIIFSSGLNVFENGLNLGVAPEEMLLTRLVLTGVWAAPGVFAFLGGVVSMSTYRIVRGGEKPVEKPVSLLTQESDLQ